MRFTEDIAQAIYMDCLEAIRKVGGDYGMVIIPAEPGRWMYDAVRFPRMVIKVNQALEDDDRGGFYDHYAKVGLKRTDHEAPFLFGGQEMKITGVLKTYEHSKRPIIGRDKYGRRWGFKVPDVLRGREEYLNNNKQSNLAAHYHAALIEWERQHPEANDAPAEMLIEGAAA